MDWDKEIDCICSGKDLGEILHASPGKLLELLGVVRSSTSKNYNRRIALAKNSLIYVLLYSLNLKNNFVTLND